MKFAFSSALAVLAVHYVQAADDMHAVVAPTEALRLAEASALPDGVTLTGSVEQIDQPSGTKEEGAVAGTGAETNDHQERLGGGLYGGGWGGWGGWGGFGPYRFGYSCGGIGGWAYPLGYWNTFGAGLYGGGCGLGVIGGGIFYC